MPTWSSGESAWKLAEAWWWGPRSLPVPSAPVTVSAHGPLAVGGFGDLTPMLRLWSDGFGVQSGPDSGTATLLDGGESVTFTAAEPLACVAFTAMLKLRSGVASVLLDLDGAVVGEDGTPNFLLRLDGLRHGDRVEIDFALGQIRVNGAKAAPQGVAAFFAAEARAAGAPEQLTIGSLGGRPFGVGEATLETAPTRAPSEDWSFDAFLFRGEGREWTEMGAISAGDVDRDGIADLLIGAPNSGSRTVDGAGLAYLVFGGALAERAGERGTGPVDAVFESARCAPAKVCA